MPSYFNVAKMKLRGSRSIRLATEALGHLTNIYINMNLLNMYNKYA